MPRVGRNDPCPCGSGKKYKHCHMPIDRAQQSETLVARQEFTDLMDALFAFCQSPLFAMDVDAAFALFWNGDFSTKGAAALGPRDLFRFFEWFVFDHATLQDKKRIVEIYRQERGDALSEPKRAMLSQWTRAPLSLHRVEDVVAGRSMLLRDLLQQGEVRVHDEGLSPSVAIGDLVVGRVLEAPNGFRLSTWPIVVSPAFQADMVESMERAWMRYQEAIYGVDKLRFLRDSGYLLNHFLLRQAQGGGERPRPSSKYYDVTPALRALERAREEEQQAELDRRRLLEEERRSREPIPEFKTIADGRLVLPSERETPDPEADEKTFAGGKLLLP